MIRWEKISRNDRQLISAIVERAVDMSRGDGEPLNTMATEMDISAAHIVNPLRLTALLDADVFNFKHDVYGIVNNIDRNTGELKNHFLPRFSRKVKSNA